MNQLLKVAAATALLLGVVESRAKVADHCVLTLEARPPGVDTPPPAPRKPCPVAIGYSVPPQGADSRRPDQGPSAARPASGHGGADAALVDATADAADGLEPSDRALHV